MTIAYPWVFLLLPLPLLLHWLLPVYATQTAAIRVPMFDLISEAADIKPSKSGRVRQRGFWRAAIFCICWASIVTALARPQYLLPPISRDIASRDLLLAIDLSRSMETADFKDADGRTVVRLAAVKQVLSKFLQERDGDRVGMIVFGNGAFVQIPFTQDLEVCQQLVDGLEVGMAGSKTALGDAIGLAINLFERSELDDKVLIALTDGNDTGSRIPPAEASEIAADQGIVIHTIGIGNPEAAGEEKLDEEALESVAQASGGRYFFAADSAALTEVYSVINQLEPRQAEEQSYRPRLELYCWPLGFAVALSFGHALLNCIRNQFRYSSTSHIEERNAA